MPPRRIKPVQHPTGPDASSAGSAASVPEVAVQPAAPVPGGSGLIHKPSSARRAPKVYTKPMRMTLFNKILVVVVVVLVVVLGGILTWKQFAGAPSVYAVYLRTGDLYFGHLTRFPSFGLKQVYLLQVNQQSKDNPLSIQRFQNVFWGPEDEITINREDVVWFTKLRSDSQLAELIRTNPTLAAPQQPAGGQQPAVQQQQPQQPASGTQEESKP